MNNRKLRYSLLLFLTAFIWGASFVAQSVSVEYVQPFTFSGVRITMGGLALLPVIAATDRKNGVRKPVLPLRSEPALLRGGLVCGVIMFVASNLQQYGIQFTTAGKCGFITTFYVALVPVFATLFCHRRYGFVTWLGVAVAMAGMYFLCLNESFTVTQGDSLVFLCAVGFAWHILAIDRFTAGADGMRLSCFQFLVCGVLSLIAMFLFEEPKLVNILAAWKPILYSGLLSCAVGYTIQVICQKELEPALASLIMSFESVFSVLAGWLLLHERLSPRELLGCALTFCAVLMVELAPTRKEKG